MRRRSEETRKTILASAQRLFLNQGYVVTTLDNIAEDAKITKKTVYGYFPDKRSLFLGVIESAVQDSWEFQVPLQAIPTFEGLQSALYVVALKLNDVLTRPEYVQLLRVTITEIVVQPDLEELIEEGVTRRALRMLTSLFSIAEANGLITSPGSKILAEQFVGGFVVRTFLDGLLKPNADAVVKQTKKELRAYVDSFIHRFAVPELLTGRES